MNKFYIFDCDGVLVDSLSPHLDFCKYQNNAYGLGLDLPSGPKEMRELLRKHKKFTPMDTLLRLFGFKETLIPEIIGKYKDSFAADYFVPRYENIVEAMGRLAAKANGIGLVTANNRNNVKLQLSGVWDYFSPGFVFTKDDVGHKPDHIKTILDSSGVAPGNVVYVGDTYSDMEDVEKVEGVNFVASGYGWQINVDDPVIVERGLPIAKDVLHLEEILLGLL